MPPYRTIPSNEEPEISLNVEINNDLLKIFTLQELSLVQKV